jgi:hypothetical protein
MQSRIRSFRLLSSARCTRCLRVVGRSCCTKDWKHRTKSTSLTFPSPLAPSLSLLPLDGLTSLQDAWLPRTSLFPPASQPPLPPLPQLSPPSPPLSSPSSRCLLLDLSQPSRPPHTILPHSPILWRPHPRPPYRRPTRVRLFVAREGGGSRCVVESEADVRGCGRG